MLCRQRHNVVQGVIVDGVEMVDFDQTSVGVVSRSQTLPLPLSVVGIPLSEDENVRDGVLLDGEGEMEKVMRKKENTM